MNDLPEGFKKFWKAYPIKRSKGTAFKAWVVNDCEKIADEIVKAVKNTKFNEDTKYIKFPANYLGAWAWLDEVEDEDKSALRDALR